MSLEGTFRVWSKLFMLSPFNLTFLATLKVYSSSFLHKVGGVIRPHGVIYINKQLAFDITHYDGFTLPPDPN